MATTKVDRDKIYKEMEEFFGLVPSFFKTIPDESLELEWRLFKKLQFDEGAIPNKYRELIGVAISAATKCRYCSLFHTEMAKLNGATEDEIEDAVHYAKSSMGWSTYLNGLQTDYEQFKSEVLKACEYARSLEGTEKELRCSDVGKGSCDFVIRATTDEEILEKVAEHARTVHDMKEMPKEVLEQVRAAIHRVKAA
jgi:AhpD family alkylhydroperoxidase